MRSLFFNFHFSLFTYLSRLPRSRGFGVQSPTDYHFLRHVIRQKLPYYAYERLESKTTHLTKREIEILRFYLRLANYIQDSYPLYIIGRDNFDGITPELRREFLTAGSSKIQAQQASRVPTTLTDAPCVLLIENLESNKQAVSEALHPKEGSAMGHVVFDMQDIAVIFCDPKRYKTVYKVNL